MNMMEYGLKPVDWQDPQKADEPAGLSRRTFVVSLLASGFALASSPLLAQAIKTDSQGLVAGEVHIPVADGVIPGYRAMPAKPGKYPVVLVLQEIFGVHEHIQDMCRRFAKQGYYAIAPELFARQGDVSKMTDIATIMSTVVAKVPDAQVNADLDATVAFAQASGHGDIQHLGLVGYCWGGRAAWVYARHNRQLKAAVAYYGLLEGMKSDIKPQDPVDFAASLTVPVLGLYAGEDSFIKPAAIERMRTGLAQSSSGSQIVVFPHANHGFNADYRPSYDKTAAQSAWALALDWLRSHGV